MVSATQTLLSPPTVDEGVAKSQNVLFFCSWSTACIQISVSMFILLNWEEKYMRMSVDYEDAPTSPTSLKLCTAWFRILHRLFEFTQNHDFRNTFILSQKLPQQHRHKSTKKNPPRCPEPADYLQEGVTKTTICNIISTYSHYQSTSSGQKKKKKERNKYIYNNMITLKVWARGVPAGGTTRPAYWRWSWPLWGWAWRRRSRWSCCCWPPGCGPPGPAGNSGSPRSGWSRGARSGCCERAARLARKKCHTLLCATLSLPCVRRLTSFCCISHYKTIVTACIYLLDFWAT